MRPYEAGQGVRDGLGDVVELALRGPARHRERWVHVDEVATKAEARREDRQQRRARELREAQGAFGDGGRLRTL